MPSDPTREQLLEQVESLKRELALRGPVPRAQPHDTRSQHTVISETPEQLTIKTTLGQPTEPLRVAPLKPVARSGKQTPQQILGRIEAIKTVIASGVNAAGYGDKRTDFRSLNELRQILNGLEDELGESLGYAGRSRQIRMVSPWHKGL